VDRTFRRNYQDWLPDERAHALGIVLEINKPVAVVQFHLKLPQTSVPVCRLMVERSSVIMPKFAC
jgi:hypothetical protein